jgi:hypothetical protein
MRCLAICALIALSAFAAAQRPVRIPVRHADPWAIKAMMEGRPIVSPEISTLLLLTGQTGAAAAVTAGSNLLMDGILFVNPTDNSLWWYSAKKA